MTGRFNAVLGIVCLWELGVIHLLTDYVAGERPYGLPMWVWTPVVVIALTNWSVMLWRGRK